ncbi:hypothetical protein KNP414_03037 [Paenibacillus mucilaginosus KNP414]|uniref:Uncharacterized protein n=1 Tax=Paenibacillus mucilaginosus (strain KNP414) TaxID=1036673 RepID=F8F8K7_PAEMK|nr:hypothetical protein KNP414_03037 [Paenibacillus mucilaginosus KNP414]
MKIPMISDSPLPGGPEVLGPPFAGSLLWSGSPGPIRA